MAARPEFLEFRIGDVTLGALSWPGLIGTPTIVAVHGIAANAWSWDPVAHHLAGGAQLVAVDLRGRGRSFAAGGPFGIRQHADDVAAVIAQLDGPVVLLGHSTGAAVALMTRSRHPDDVTDIVLVDGGPPLPCSDVDVEHCLAHLFGPAITRLSTIWPDRVSYHAMWAQHPAFVDGIGPDLERNLLADLIDVEDGFRTAVDEAAVLADARDLFDDDEIRSLLDRAAVPVTIVRAEYGPLGAPPPLITSAERERHRRHHWVEAAGLNDYTVISSATGASLVADTIRSRLNSPRP